VLLETPKLTLPIKYNFGQSIRAENNWNGFSISIDQPAKLIIFLLQPTA